MGETTWYYLSEPAGLLAGPMATRDDAVAAKERALNNEMIKTKAHDSGRTVEDYIAVVEMDRYATLYPAVNEQLAISVASIRTRQS